MPNFKKFYFVLTSHRRWGRGLSLKGALKSAGITTLSSKNQFMIHTGLVKAEADDVEVDNLCKCFNVNNFGDVTKYTDPSDEDQEMLDKLFVGWVSEDSFM